MFVNPARWGETWGNTKFQALVIGSKKEHSVTDRDTIEYALNVLDKTEAEDKEFFLSNEYHTSGASIEKCCFCFSFPLFHLQKLMMFH